MKVVSREVPYHARIYPSHSPIKGVNTAREVVIFYKEDVQKEIDDEDGNNDYDDEEAPLAEIRRAHIIADTEEHKECEHSVFKHSYLLFSILQAEHRIRENGWAIKDLKIFHIWNISLGKEPRSHWSVKYQHETNKIEVEINDGENEHGTKLVDFILDTQECDKSLSVTVDDCEVNYSLFANALRVEFEIRPYDADGNPVLNVNGHVHAYILLGKTLHEKVLFCVENKSEASEHVSASGALVLRNSTLIFSRRFADFVLDVSLNDNAGKFLVDYFTVLPRRSIAIDEEYYIIGEEGYIILTVKWACLCVDQGVCVCPSGGAAVGDVAAFQATYNYGYGDPVRICRGYGRNRGKIIINRASEETTSDEEDSEDSTSQEATSTCVEEDNASQEATSTCDEDDGASQETTSTCDEKDSDFQETTCDEEDSE